MSFLADRSAVSIGLGGIPSLRSGTGGLNPSLDLNFAVSKSLDPRITFTRASEARYYDASTVALAEQNLLTQSQAFNSASWSKVNLTVTADATAAPDGTATADKLVENSATGEHAVNNPVASIASTVYTGSVYIKAGERTIARISLANLANSNVWFDLSVGTIGTQQSSVITATITSVGNGWYRCTATWTSNSTANYFVTGPATSNGVSTYAGDGTSGIYVWGAQLEQRSTVTAYTPTTTAAITNYIPVLQVAPINLLTYSEEFDNAVWTKSGVTIEPNVVQSPDNTINADKLTENTASGDHRTFQNVSLTSGTSYTFTVYAKPAGRTLVKITSATAAVMEATFDIANGSVTNTVSGTAAIAAVGNGWYRLSLSVTATATTSTNIQIRLVDTGTNTSYTGDGTSGIYIWGAQLQTGSSAGAYARTTNVSTGAPRFDHNPVTRESLGLLIEEQRTNLLTYSEQFDNAAWTKTDATVYPNATVAPDGTLTGDKLIADTTASALHRIQVQPTTATATAYALSVYAKAGEQGFVAIRDVSLGISVWFNLTTGAVATANPGIAGVITSVGNGWYRCVALRTTATANTLWAIGGSSADAVTTYTGNGFSGIYIWGAQLEAGAFATSYVPTVASQVTRSADAASMTGTNFSSWYRQDEGTLYAEAVSGQNATTNNSLVEIYGAVRANNYYNMRRRSGTSFGLESVANGSVVVPSTAFGGSWANNTSAKLAATIRSADYQLTANGVAITSSAVAGVVDANAMAIGATGVASALWNGHIKKIAYYPVRLANATLQSLTA